MLLSEKQLFTRAARFMDESALCEDYDQTLSLLQRREEEIRSAVKRLQRNTNPRTDKPYLSYSDGERITDAIYYAKKEFDKSGNLKDYRDGVISAARRLSSEMRSMPGITSASIDDIITGLGEISDTDYIKQRENEKRREVERNQHNYAMRELDDRSKEEYLRTHKGDARGLEQNSASTEGRRDRESFWSRLNPFR